jgi:hypothetical protein
LRRTLTGQEGGIPVTLRSERRWHALEAFWLFIGASHPYLVRYPPCAMRRTRIIWG